MSLETWVQEFYPQSVESTKEFTTTELIKHSLKKWEGLTRKNLNRHGLTAEMACIIDRENSSEFSIDSTTCSLCARYLADSCVECPIYIAQGIPCDADQVEGISQYDAFLLHRESGPMINILKKALEIETQKENG